MWTELPVAQAIQQEFGGLLSGLIDDVRIYNRAVKP